MFWTATAIFVCAYAIIVSEKINKTKVALFGAALTPLPDILSPGRLHPTRAFG